MRVKGGAASLCLVSLSRISTIFISTSPYVLCLFARTGRPGRELDDRTAQGRGFEPRSEQRRCGTGASPWLQGSLGQFRIISAVVHFGFSSRNHFARDYRQLFGEAPSETLQRSATPGIRSHPVSVAHRPQMAMARR